MIQTKRKLGLWITILILAGNLQAQVTERVRPSEWNSIVEGGRFVDLFRPIPTIGTLTKHTWGANEVIPRYVDNGIENAEWSYWGGNILIGDDGKYHLFVCRWPESSSKGHMEWGQSTVVHAIADSSSGPFKPIKFIGKGHNPEAFRMKNGDYIIYVIGGHYYSDNINGPWEYRKFDFDTRNREIPEGLTNLTFSQREDGSYIMMCRGGGIWISKDGQSTYNLITEKSVYPEYDGEYEDPVIWRTNIQYHAIVNDWLGRIAYYMRSKDGIHWKHDPGEAYMPGIAIYEDGTREDWFKYERIKMLQDKYGRAIQANFAVIDTIKWEDLGNDNHSSKNITIPLTHGKLLTILNKEPIEADTKLIKVEIKAEEGFNPHTDIDLKSLHFGAPEEVNFGKGCTLVETEKSGKDLILTFKGEGNGINEDNFTAKLLGKTAAGKLLFGYARLPWLNYLEPALSARLPQFFVKDGKGAVELEVQNFGQVDSENAIVKVEVNANGKWAKLIISEVAPLKPYEATVIKAESPIDFTLDELIDIRVVLSHPKLKNTLLSGQVSVKAIN